MLLHPAGLFGRAHHKLIPIDWALCLHGKQPGSADLKDLQDRHGLREYVTSTEIRNAVTGSADFARITARLADWSGATARLRAIIEWMPAEWEVPAEWKTEMVDYFLRRIDRVLERLQDEHDTEAVFPNWQAPLTA